MAGSKKYKSKKDSKVKDSSKSVTKTPETPETEESHATRSQEALESGKTTFVKNEKLSIAHYNSGIKLQSEGNHSSAIESYKKAIAANPTWPNSYYAMGLSQYELGQYSDALGSYNKALDYNPNYARVHNAIGDALLALGNEIYKQGDVSFAIHNAEDALVAYDQATNIRPEENLFHCNKARLLDAFGMNTDDSYLSVLNNIIKPQSLVAIPDLLKEFLTEFCNTRIGQGLELLAVGYIAQNAPALAGALMDSISEHAAEGLSGIVG